MSDLEDFKLGGMHNAGDPDGLRVVESKNKWAALADRIEALGLPRPIRGELVMPLFARVVTAFEKQQAALTDVFALIDEGYLVRDIANDGEPGFAMRQLPYVQRLVKARATLSDSIDRAGDEG